MTKKEAFRLLFEPTGGWYSHDEFEATYRAFLDNEEAILSSGWERMAPRRRYVPKPRKEQWWGARSATQEVEVRPGLFAYDGMGMGVLWLPSGKVDVWGRQARQICQERGLEFVWLDAFNYRLVEDSR